MIIQNSQLGVVFPHSTGKNMKSTKSLGLTAKSWIACDQLVMVARNAQL